MMVAAELRQTEARDGPAGDAVALNNSKYIELPKNVTKTALCSRRPAADHLPLGADRQVDERRPDLRVRQKGAPGRAVRPAHLGHPRSWTARAHWKATAILEQHPKLGRRLDRRGLLDTGNVTVNLTPIPTSPTALSRSGRATRPTTTDSQPTTATGVGIPFNDDIST